MENSVKFTDLASTELKVGDVVVTKNRFALKMGRVKAFTKKMVIVDFGTDFTLLYPWRMAKTENQSITEPTEGTDLSNTKLEVGDKVVAYYEQLLRIGRVDGFTKKQVKVTFDFGAVGVCLQTANLPYKKMAKVENQNIGLKDYYDNIKRSL